MFWTNQMFFDWSKTEKKICFGPIKSLLSFSTAKTEKKIMRKKDWLFDGLMPRTRYTLQFL
jgi:hypothetical protein